MRSIGFFNSVMSWGGGEKWHYDAASYFAEKGYHVYFYVRKNSELHKKLAVSKTIVTKLIEVNGVSFLNPLKILRLKKSFKEDGLSSVIINLPNDVKLAAHAAKLANIKKIIYRRGSAIPIKNTLLNRFAFKHWLTDILANSQATKKTILQHNPFLFPKEKIKVIYNPINIEEFIEQPSSPVYVAKDNEIIIGNLGRLEYEKNHQFLIQLSEKLQVRGIPHKIIIGGNGRLDQELKEDASRRNVEKNILFLGFIPDVKNLLMSVDIFILPSLWEGFGYVLAEASLCKKPIIAFNLSSIPEVVVNNKTGFLIKNDLAECIEKIEILRENSILREQMGNSGFKYVTSTFNKDKIMKELETYISSSN